MLSACRLNAKWIDVGSPSIVFIASDQFENVKTVLLDRGHRMIRGLLRTVPGSEFPRVHSDFAEQASFE
jgi:hypothetical protein